MATHSSVLAWEIPWTKSEPGGQQSIESQRVRHDLATEYTQELAYHMLASYAVGRTWDKNSWYHSISRTGREHTALTSTLAIADTSVSIFLFILYIIDANHLILTKAQGQAFEIINRDCQVTFFSFTFFPSLSIKLSISVNFWVEVNVRDEVSRIPQKKAQYL